MKFKNPLLVVTDLQKSQTFYKEVLGLRKILDFGANITLTGGLSLQTKESWLDFLGKEENALHFHGNVMELYFEEDDFDPFIERLQQKPDIEYVHPVQEHRWGQRVVRFYDPDHHIIEVGENLKTVCLRFQNSGMTEEEIAVRMDVPIKLVHQLLRKSH